MYFVEKFQSSLATFGDLGPLITIISITFEIYVDQYLVKYSYSWWNYLILTPINTPNCLQAMERKVVIVKRKYWTIGGLFFWIRNEIVTSIGLNLFYYFCYHNHSFQMVILFLFVRECNF